MSSRKLPDLPPPLTYTRGPQGNLTSAQATSPQPPTSASAEGFADATQQPPLQVVTVGNFDGVHVGHAAILTELRRMAAELSAESVVLTFDPHPATLVRPDKAPTPLSTASRRAELLLNQGVDRVLVQPMVPAVVRLTAREFFDQVLCGQLAATGLVEGVDFHFGRGREGNVSTLAAFCGERGLRFAVVEPVQHRGSTVSSSRVREMIAAGEVSAAASLLTEPYRVTGQVVAGARRGRTLGFPTANLREIATLLPAAGVYAAVASLPSSVNNSHASLRYPAAVHVGVNVSFDETALTVEAHLIGFDGDLYGHTLHVDFLQRLRDTHRFDSREALVSQLEADVQQTIDFVSGSAHLLPPSSASLTPPHPHAS